MDKKEIKELIKFFDLSGLIRLEIKKGDFELKLEKGGVVKEVVSEVNKKVDKIEVVSKQNDEPKKEGEFEYVKSPMVGTFYKAPAPGAKPFVNVGDKVKKGTTLCIVEAMKIMNEIEAEFDMEIVEVLVEDATPVEFDTPLFKVKKI